MMVNGVDQIGPADEAEAAFESRARHRLEVTPESGFPEIQAWRRAYATMGLKPTQYRSASEALLRRFRTSGALPKLHPLVNLCNAASLAFAVPIAVYDRAQTTHDLQVREADGTEPYLAFSGETERPDAGEVIFADSDGRAHARRWAHKQSLQSVVKPETQAALIVAEALHETALADITALVSELGQAIQAAGGQLRETALLPAPEAQWDSDEGGAGHVG
ncbi:MAG: phenylalanine--tRNA ligase beta subunit-related protein [Pseudomonadota bacterium]